GAAGGARGDAPRRSGARLRREPLLRQHGTGASLPNRLVGHRHARWLRAPARARCIAAAHHSGPRPAGDAALQGARAFARGGWSAPRLTARCPRHGAACSLAAPCEPLWRRRTMRHFGKALAAAAVLAATCGAASAQQTVTLKMQATWPSSLTLYDNFTI